MTPLEHIMGLMDPTYSEPIRHSMAQSILDKHAHELAEQQRKNCQEVTCGPTEAQCACWDQADLIDPKVQTTGTS